MLCLVVLILFIRMLCLVVLILFIRMLCLVVLILFIRMLCLVFMQFDVQIENPLMVLNQEESKKFIKSNKPGDHFKFFYKGTQLQKLNNVYTEIDKCMGHTDLLVKGHRASKATMNAEVEEAERK